MKILCLGPEGSHSHVAASFAFSSEEVYQASSFAELVSLLDVYDDAVALLPVENSIAGNVHENIDTLCSGEYKVNSEVYLQISHNLLARPETDITDIQKVLVHPQARLQCSVFLKEHPEWELVTVSSTAEGARLVSLDSTHSLATISNLACADIYNLTIVKKNLGNVSENQTRFLALSRELVDFPPGDANKCTLLIKLKNKPGALLAILKILHADGYNITKIETRPIPLKPWTYQFLIDFEFKKLLDISTLKEASLTTKILGIYKTGKHFAEH